MRFQRNLPADRFSNPGEKSDYPNQQDLTGPYLPTESAIDALPGLRPCRGCTYPKDAPRRIGHLEPFVHTKAHNPDDLTT